MIPLTANRRNNVRIKIFSVRLLLNFFKSVSHSSHSLNELISQFFPKILDMGIHDPFIPEIVLTPDLIQKILPRIDPAGILKEQPQKIKFLLGKLHFFLIAEKTVFLFVQP